MNPLSLLYTWEGKAQKTKKVALSHTAKSMQKKTFMLFDALWGTSKHHALPRGSTPSPPHLIDSARKMIQQAKVLDVQAW